MPRSKVPPGAPHRGHINGAAFLNSPGSVPGSGLQFPSQARTAAIDPRELLLLPYIDKADRGARLAFRYRGRAQDGELLERFPESFAHGYTWGDSDFLVPDRRLGLKDPYSGDWLVFKAREDGRLLLADVCDIVEFRKKYEAIEQRGSGDE